MKSIMLCNSAFPWFEKNSRLIFVLALCGFIAACGTDSENKQEPAPIVNITNGQFDVVAIMPEDLTNEDGAPFGSGSLSFKYSGDDSGAFSVSGPLAIGQIQNDAVGATLVKLEENDLGTQNEGFTVVGFHPLGNGKADIFVLGTKTNTSVLPIKNGDAFGIGPLEFFNGLFLKGIKISDWWDVNTNKLEVAEIAYTIESGFIQFATRDSTHFRGTFAGTTATGPNISPLPFLLQ
ncbi:MAG: hypothetical protein ACE5HS_08760 [bacterium]